MRWINNSNLKFWKNGEIKEAYGKIYPCAIMAAKVLISM